MRILILVGLLFVTISPALATWETEEIDYSLITQVDMGIWTTGLYQNSMVLDSDRLPHVAYLKYTNSAGSPRCEIWYCNAYGSFIKENAGYLPLDTSTQPPGYVPDIASVLDAQESPHIFVATLIMGMADKSFITTNQE